MCVYAMRGWVYFFRKFLVRPSISRSQMLLLNAAAKPPGVKRRQVLRQPQTTTRRGEEERKKQKRSFGSKSVSRSSLAEVTQRGTSSVDERQTPTKMPPLPPHAVVPPRPRAKWSVRSTASKQAARVGEVSPSASPQVSVVIHGRSCHAGVASHGY